MKAEDLKLVVKEKYSEIATQSKLQNQSSCCGSTCGCNDSTYSIMSESYDKLEGYNPDADLGFVVLKGSLPEKLRKDAEIYAGCVSGAVDIDEYLEIFNKQGFKNVTVHKQKEIAIPDEVLEKYLSKEEMESFKNGKTGIFSITVSGYEN